MYQKLQHIKKYCTIERMFNITLIVILSALFIFGYVFIHKLDVQASKTNKVIANVI